MMAEVRLCLNKKCENNNNGSCNCPQIVISSRGHCMFGGESVE